MTNGFYRNKRKSYVNVLHPMAYKKVVKNFCQKEIKIQLTGGKYIK